jgi:hypothetical protein
MRTPRPDDQTTSAWDALHQGSDREAFDSPARFELSGVSTVINSLPNARRRPEPRPVSHAPSPQAPPAYRPAQQAPSGYRHAPQAPPAYAPPPQPLPAFVPPPQPAPDYHLPSGNAPSAHIQSSHNPSAYLPSAYAPSGQRRSRVRPYARTGGRTRSDHNLALEALVSTSDKARRFVGVGSPEHRAICNLCNETRSIAEIAAYLFLPLGVVKVLVGDMADAGLVIIHQPGFSLGDQGSRDFMERVLQGLRAL